MVNNLVFRWPKPLFFMVKRGLPWSHRVAFPIIFRVATKDVRLPHPAVMLTYRFLSFHKEQKWKRRHEEKDAAAATVLSSIASTFDFFRLVTSLTAH